MEEYSGDLFHQVVTLKDFTDSWDKAAKQIPVLPRGWFELSHLPVEDRVEFTRAYWVGKLPFSSIRLEERLEAFFDELDNIEVFALQEKKDGPFAVHMIYSLKHEAGFFQGKPPAQVDNLESFQKQFGAHHLPSDYLAFLEIHDGFSKYTDTGIIKTRDMPRVYRHFQDLLGEDLLVRPDGQFIHPQSLIPFYESYGLHCYQCFYTDWSLGEEMGNVYFSEHDRTMSNFLDEEHLEQHLAFPTFLGWLLFYLEDIWHL